MSVTVREVVTAASDGLAPTLRPGRLTVRLPALLTQPGATRSAWLEVDGATGPHVVLSPAHVSWLSTSSVGRPGSVVVVRLVADGTVVARWRHAVSR